MNLGVFILSVADCLMFSIYRDFYDVIQYYKEGSYYIDQSWRIPVVFTRVNPIWWSLMLLTAVINILILIKINKGKINLVSITLGVAVGTLFSFAISFILRHIGSMFILVYWRGLFSYDALDMTTVKYILMTAAYIYVYNIVACIICRRRGVTINRMNLVIHNAGNEKIEKLDIYLGGNEFLFDTIGGIAPDESIRKSIVLDDKSFFDKLSAPYNIYLKYGENRSQIGSLLGNYNELLCVSVEKRNNEINIYSQSLKSRISKKAKNEIRRKNSYRWIN